MVAINRVTLLGTISRYGVEVRYTNTGTPHASFTMAVTELGQDGKGHITLIPCEVWGKRAEAAGELDAGALVLFEGKLQKRKKSEAWELVVSGFEVTPVRMPTPALTGSH
jgi:single-stranded DNA-binding protein